MQTNRARLYICALLQHIPNEAIQNRFKRLMPSDVSGYEEVLRLADQYSITQAGAIQTPFPFSFLGSPFENLKKRTGEYRFGFKPQKLSLEEDWFPDQKTATDANQVKTLWESVSANLEQLDWAEDNLRQTAESTLSILSRYTTTLANPSNMNQEVSWFDYAKIKAGMALCIHDYLMEEKTGWSDVIADAEKPVLLIRGDLSGIQNFILDIASKQASKNLKGRSFYIQLLGDTVLKRMLKEFDLFGGNIVFASGGNFFLLAPNTARVKVRFEELAHEITQAIFKEHGARIALVMGAQEVSQKEMLSGAINQPIKQLFESTLDRNKKRKYAGLIAEDYDSLFKPSEAGGEAYTDAITGEEVDRADGKVYAIVEGESLPQLVKKETLGENPKVFRDVTAKQIFLGHHLKDVKFLVFSPDKINRQTQNEEDTTLNPCGLGIHTYIFRDDSALESLKGVRNAEVYAINRTDDKSLESKLTMPVFPMFYGGNKAPVLKEFKEEEGEKRYPGTPKYFHELSGEGHFQRLAVLKMDVDGLGAIFKDLEGPHLTFSYYASLSRNLDWFFKGYLNTIWEKNPDFKEYTQIIYSGGDDLFIIGRWDLMIRFAETIHMEFSRFACSAILNPEDRVTISGGISIVTDKFPVIKAAAFADTAEKMAKEHRLAIGDAERKQWPGAVGFTKNTISILGTPLHWETEYALVKELKEELVRYISPNDNPKLGLPKSLLGKIQMYAEMADGYEKEKSIYETLKAQHNTGELKTPSPRWIWSIAYDFSRFAERVKGENFLFMKKLQDKVDENIKTYLEGKKKMVEQIQRALFTNTWNNRAVVSKYHFIQLLNLAAKWAELEIRKNHKNDKL